MSIFKADVVVVGGGPSGIAATHTLLNAAFTVALLEARPEIGGRAQTLKMHDGLLSQMNSKTNKNIIYTKITVA